ncbi:MAG: GNAT family N-acetyltransferase, partial [Chloroflexota bacterium]
MHPHSALDIYPLTPDRWDDLTTLFGRQGAVAGCWCMWWRLRASEFSRGKRADRRQAFRERVQRGDPPGLLAYAGGRPVGWVSVAPREEFPRLVYSRDMYRPLDDHPGIWSI